MSFPAFVDGSYECLGELGVQKIVTSCHPVAPMRNIPHVIIKLYATFDVIYDLRTCLPLFYHYTYTFNNAFLFTLTLFFYTQHPSPPT